MGDRIDLLSVTAAELQQEARARLTRGAGLAAMHYRVAMRDGEFEPNAGHVSAAGSTGWRQHFFLDLPECVRAVHEPTTLGATLGKAILRARDGAEFECVHVPIGTRHHSLCVSTQVGCALACRFCETGRMGKLRDLSIAEIVGQVVATRRALGWRPRNLVFMGMGEPLDNLAGLIPALRILTDPRGLAFGPSQLTVCTVGRVAGIRCLTELGMPRLNLSLSLNAADDVTRRNLMPVAAVDASLADLQRALVEFRPRTNFQFGIHYCLMPGINDTRTDARAIARFCAPLGRVMVHVIPYNPGTAPICRAPGDTEVDRFIGWLRDEGLPVRRRITKGRSVMAACGQLGDRDLRPRLRTNETHGPPNSTVYRAQPG